ncbi:protein-L-isoaspartate(D-aspartate) O-methyltransferase [Pelotomaculum terephthalicicum JT]|uniref:protein-L-isoaspartate(D-aspartate) O-methyltransferase n=1 Tax=Pelotomaculum TaxID=191373 RepID=UPI0009C860BA|nr:MULTISPECIES: protein-L-isoaspartate(D-aspartate) O-methyltransferase [Pelotomaculum]MCG9966503.1 protein-L-isoaspartate(D-aspartate) O-methyltransferase [Pelotomaculum terephthalicicum JT]OPX86001.1 MAG: Protein-L-isoaspartate O-methyltransferase [Pelotomaculum sp. PtaB.Bin117]OPY60687.1 MAG: Protein-L-isoaspartate O-methyltransferase [Pelotomaculum sp. PtaU1.Bin065]
MDFPQNSHNIAGDRAEERRRMVEKQLIPYGISNEAVLSSMLEVPRHLFVSEQLQAYAYADCALPIDEGQTISQPYIVALMAEALRPDPADAVLEIGTGSGYAAAVLSRIVSKVYTIERHKNLAGQAQSRFQTLKYENIIVRIGDGSKGWTGKAPFDGILVAAGAPVIPESLGNQLKAGGCLVVPVGDRHHQELLRLEKKPDGSFDRENLGGVRFVPLVGEEGWNGNKP